MFELNEKIASSLLDSLTLKELEAMLEQKKQRINKVSTPRKLTEKEKFKAEYRRLLKKKLYPPKGK